MVRFLSIRILVVFLFFFFVSAGAAAQSFSGTVVGVSDGDTVTVMHESRGEKIRLSGVDCPEKAQAFGAVPLMRR